MMLFCRKSVIMLPLLWLLGLALNVGSLKLSEKEANDTFLEILAELPGFFQARYSRRYPGAFKICAPENQMKMEFSHDYSKDANVGKYIGIPGVDFPVYQDIPVTSFTCSDKPRIPGMYADQETGCQVFHACQTTEIQSMLCPVGTTFNQAIRACDYWYNSNCSMSPHYYTNPTSYPYFSHLKKLLREMLGLDVDWKTQFNGSYPDLPRTSPAERFVKLLPVKFKTIVYSDPETPIEKTADWFKGIRQQSTQARTVEHGPLDEDDALLEDEFYNNPYWADFDPKVLCESKQYADLAHFIITYGLTDFFLESLRQKLRLDVEIKDVDPPTVSTKPIVESLRFPKLHEKETIEQIRRINFMEPETETISAGTPPRSPNRRRVVVSETEQTRTYVKPTKPDDSVTNTMFQTYMKLVEKFL